MVNSSNLVYMLQDEQSVSHLLDMNDLNLFAKDDSRVKMFSNNICMEFRQVKCSKAAINAKEFGFRTENNDSETSLSVSFIIINNLICKEYCHRIKLILSIKAK